MTKPDEPAGISRRAASARPPFVGRRAELGRLDAALVAAGRGEPQFVLVEGVAGIGKSALVDRFLAIHGDDVALLRARADENERDLAFGVVGQLGAQLRAAGPAVPPRPTATEHDTLRAGAELLELLDVVQRDAATVVVVDDAHLADAPSTASLVFACRRLLADRVLVLLTARPGRLDPAWERLVEGGAGLRIALDGLQSGELAELAAVLGTSLSDAEARRLEAQTDGHPLYARTLLASGRPVGAEGLDDPAPPPPPPALGELVRRRLAACSPPARALVEAAAVLGRTCRLSEAVSLAGVAEAAGALAEASEAGLLAEPGHPPLELRFAHALVHAACYQALGVVRRVALHRRAAEITSGTRRLQHRLAAATGADAALAEDLEACAAGERRSGDLLAAAGHLRQASQVSLPGALAERRLLEAVETWLIAGEANRALAHADEVRALEPTPFREHVVGYLALVAGRLPEADAAFRRAWGAVEAGGAHDPADLRGRVAVCMAILTVVDLHVDELQRWGEEALASTAADPVAAPFGWFCMALSLGTLGRGPEALRRLEGSGVPRSADVEAAQGLVEMWTDDLAAAHRHLGGAFARARGGEPTRATQALGFLAECEHRMGRFDEASVHAELAVDAAAEAGRVWDLPLLHALAAYPAAARGDFSIAEAHVRAAADWATLVPIAAFRAYAAAAAAALALARDDPVALLAAAETLDATYRLADPGTASFGPVLAEAQCRLGRLEEAEASLAAFEAHAGALGRRSALLGARRVRGSLEARRGDQGRAEAAFADGARLAESLQLPLERVRLDEARADALLAGGRRQEARTLLGSALAGFERIGARPYAASVRRRLEGTGAPSSARPPLELSATEAMVARLVGAGCTNKEIAAELVVSVKAVEYHLTNIYRRLGVSSRVMLAQMVGAPR